MNNFILKVAAAAIIIPVGLSLSHKYEQKAFDTYQLTEVQQPVATRCRTSMQRHEVSFKNGVQKTKGCACIAKYAASQASPEEFRSYSALVDVTFDMASGELRNKKSVRASNYMDGYFEDYKVIQNRYKLTDKRFGAMLTGVTEAFGVCASAKTDEGQALANITSLPEYKARPTYKKRKNVELLKKSNPPKLRKSSTQR